MGTFCLWLISERSLRPAGRYAVVARPPQRVDAALEYQGLKDLIVCGVAGIACGILGTHVYVFVTENSNV